MAPPKNRLPATRVASFIQHDRVEELLRPFVPDDGERAFVVRCMLDEGPLHHRGATYTLLALLGELVKKIGADLPRPARDVTVPMRLPPHLLEREDQSFPLRLPTHALEQLAPGRTADQEAMIDCLTDGPPHHALANAAMVALLTALLDHAGGS